MSKLANVIAKQLRWMLACFVVCVLALAGVSLWGLSLATSAAESLYHDKLQTVQATSSVSDGIRDAYEEASTVLVTDDPSTRQKLIATLFNDAIPSVDVQLDKLRRLPTIDSATERALVATIWHAWVGLRNAIVPGVAFAGSGSPALRVRVAAQFDPIEETIARLRAHEQRDGAQAASQASDAWSNGLRLILSAAAAALLAATLVVKRGARSFVERAVADEAAQQEFAQTMQLASNEDDAYRLIARHLERVVEQGQAVVLNRNNSADRLEAMTAIPSDWPLAQHLDGAHPRSCAAVRTARTYLRDPAAAPLLTCDVCGDCPRRSLCTPITVAGEVIGSVLVESSSPFDHDDEARVVQTVAQGAPVLANLRNLAIAEFRAKTDALTGLPNKRAVAHTLKHMVAQASRTVTPLAVLSLDLDHFKQFNDQFGHPKGDDVLAAVGTAIRATIREADFAGRNGGEEFLILLPATDREGARNIAEKITSAIREIFIHGVDRRITTSIGIAVLPDDAGDAENLERASDRALYTAKTNGRDRIETVGRPADADQSGLVFNG